MSTKNRVIRVEINMLTSSGILVGVEIDWNARTVSADIIRNIPFFAELFFFISIQPIINDAITLKAKTKRILNELSSTVSIETAPYLLNNFRVNCNRFYYFVKSNKNEAK